jgi:hypothetical protein
MTKASRNTMLILVAAIVVIVAIFAYIYVQNQKAEQETDLFSKAIQVAPTLDNPSQAIKDTTSK